MMNGKRGRRVKVAWLLARGMVMIAGDLDDIAAGLSLLLVAGFILLITGLGPKYTTQPAGRLPHLCAQEVSRVSVK